MKKVRFGVIGTNNITDWVIQGGREDERFELTAVCSRTHERATEFAAKHGIPYTFTSLEEMAASDYVDAIYIATPNCCHAEQAILCMSHGKHVLCEKPFASNAREASAMITAARQYGVTLMEAMISTLNPNFLRVKEQLSTLGTLRRYFACYCQYSSRYDKFKEGTILNAFKPELSNGAVMDIGIYTIYPMIALFGRPQSIEAQGIVLHTGVDGQGAVNFRYPGMDATVLYSKIANSFLPTEIEGEEGNLIIDHIHIARQVDLIPRIPTSQGQSQQDTRQALSIPLSHSPYYYEIKEFIDLVISGHPESSVNTLDTSLATMEVIDEIRRQLGVTYPADA
ncbi:MAG: Gfo/Idh/MocA family oxidoreductase [Bacteroidaceae bacterium]|nr:Gfo/Idh/MocA family oxidoreductase [Bacteroidaceae bacterium]